MKIKEDMIKDFLKVFNNKNIELIMQGSVKEKLYLKNSNIIFLNDSEFEINDSKNKIILNLSYIEEIYFEEKNKLKFLIENNLEILIIFL